MHYRFGHMGWCAEFWKRLLSLSPDVSRRTGVAYLAGIIRHQTLTVPPKFTFASLTHPANLRKADKRLLRFKMLFGPRRLSYSCTEALSSEGPRSRHRSEYQSGTAPLSRALDFISWRVLVGKKRSRIPWGCNPPSGPGGRYVNWTHKVSCDDPAVRHCPREALFRETANKLVNISRFSAPEYRAPSINEDVSRQHGRLPRSWLGHPSLRSRARSISVDQNSVRVVSVDSREPKRRLS